MRRINLTFLDGLLTVVIIVVVRGIFTWARRVK